MGLLKQSKSLNDEPIGYWTIGYMRIDRLKRFVDCKFYGYESELDAKKHISPRFIRSVRLIEDEYDAVFNSPLVAKKTDPFEVMYKYAKANEVFFKDAEDSQ